MEPAKIIEVAGLSKSFGGLKALDNVSFVVRQGEIFGYLGPNGAGKTTTIKILCGLLPREGGTVWIGGLDIAEEPVAVKQRLGVVPDESNLYPELTCQRNLDYLSELYGLARAVRRARSTELLASFDLADKADIPFHALSRGMKRRLTIAAALVHAPDILFLDEPTTGLDVPSARALRDLIQRINRQDGVTVFLTTHNLFEAEALCQYVQIIHKGQALAAGTAQAIRQRVTGRKTLEVAFDGPVANDWWQAPGFRGGPPVPVDGRWRLKIAGQELHEVLTFLLARAEAAGVRIIDLEAGGASLEEAFLAILQEQQRSPEVKP
ncbi:MAG: ABC transporter ATP-binding protein [Desulfobacca sp.]|uniref:ABC transporter ATP-binding protein n=1 Tax=Desulfobacca sp. TaxID=2067990 RepID=UPI00404B8885